MTATLTRPPVLRAATTLTAALVTYATLALALHPEVRSSSTGAVLNLVAAFGLIAALHGRMRSQRLAVALKAASVAIVAINPRGHSLPGPSDDRPLLGRGDRSRALLPRGRTDRHLRSAAR